MVRSVPMIMAEDQGGGKSKVKEKVSGEVVSIEMVRNGLSDVVTSEERPRERVWEWLPAENIARAQGAWHVGGAARKSGCWCGASKGQAGEK